MADSLPVPVTIIGGYLGAGKTTLINELLTGQHGRRITIVVNDFGAINIDSHLIAARDGNSISLTNGCICCSVAGDLATELRRLAGADPVPEQIIVEASGVADPARVANAVRGWSSMQLHRTVTLFDPVAVRRLSADKFAGTTVRRQLRNAHLLLPSKLDVVTANALESVINWLATVVPDAAALTGPPDRAGQIAMLLDLSTADTVVGSDEPRLLSSATSSSSDFASLTWYPQVPFNEARLRALFRDLGNRLQRCKGWVLLDRSLNACAPAKALVQHGPAGTEISIVPTLPGGRSVLVLIFSVGQCSDAQLQSLLTACEHHSNSEPMEVARRRS